MALRLLIVADLSQSPAAMLHDSVAAFQRWSRCEVTLVAAGVPDAAMFASVDAILLHYSIFIDQPRALPDAARTALRAARGVKAVWQQDEYRNVAGLARAMREIDAAVVMTCLKPADAARLYGPHLDRAPLFLDVLTGYVSDRLLAQESRPYAARRTDIGYRGRLYPLWLGAQATQRVAQARTLRRAARRAGLRCDIAWRESDRLYGEAWNAFLGDCRASFVTESGASVFDPDGALPDRVRRHILAHPFVSEQAIAAATYAPLEGDVDYAQISPRIFEAIAARSLLLFAPGDYCGLLTSAHGVELAANASNIDAIAETIRDAGRAGALIERAQVEILQRPDLHEKAFVARVDAALHEAAAAQTPRRSQLTSPIARARTARPPQRPVLRALFAAARFVIERLPPPLSRYCEALLRLSVDRLRTRV